MIPDPNGIDVLIPLGRGSHFKDAELKYCLRSLEKHARGVRRIVIVGDKPRWLSKEAEHFYSPFMQFNKDARIANKTLWACEQCALTDRFLFANDDYVFLKDFDAREVPNYQRGKLFVEKPTTVYHRIMLDTHDALIKARKPTFNYDGHIPLVFDRGAYIKLRHWWEQAQTLKYGFAQKSVYANNALKKPGPHLDDCKIGQYTSEADLWKRVGDRFMFSYADSALYAGMEVALYNRFPTPSRFEV